MLELEVFDPAPPDSVVLYTIENYRGLKSVITAGWYGPHELRVPNDNVRSVKVAPGMKVTVYEHDGGGWSHTCTHDTPSLGAMGNWVTSLGVEKI